MKSKIVLNTILISIVILAACAGENKKESRFQTSCYKGVMKNQTILTEAEMNAYAIQLPPEIHGEVEKRIKDKQTIDAVKIIRGCLDINLASTIGIKDRIQIKLNLN